MPPIDNGLGDVDSDTDGLDKEEDSVGAPINKETDVVIKDDDAIAQERAERQPSLSTDRKRPLRSLSISSILRPTKAAGEQSLASRSNVEAYEDTLANGEDESSNVTEFGSATNHGSGRDVRSDKFLPARESSIISTDKAKNDKDEVEEASKQIHRQRLDKSVTGKLVQQCNIMSAREGLCERLERKTRERTLFLAQSTGR